MKLEVPQYAIGTVESPVTDVAFTDWTGVLSKIKFRPKGSLLLVTLPRV